MYSWYREKSESAEEEQKHHIFLEYTESLQAYIKNGCIL